MAKFKVTVYPQPGGVERVIEAKTAGDALRIFMQLPGNAEKVGENNAKVCVGKVVSGGGLPPAKDIAPTATNGAHQLRS